MHIRYYPFFLFFIFTTYNVNCQTPAVLSDVTIAQPVIDGYGNVFSVENPDLTVNENDIMKVVFDISSIDHSKDGINPLILTAARFLNLHAKNGLPLKNMKVALIIHGDASKDILNNKAYFNRYGIENPHKELIEKLNQAGVDIYLCGQTAGSRDIKRNDMLPEVKLALSAMTALVKLQNNNYKLINFN